MTEIFHGGLYIYKNTHKYKMQKKNGDLGLAMDKMNLMIPLNFS